MLAAGGRVVADGSEPAQVRIPESSLAPARARHLGATAGPGTGPSIAGAPVVMALTAAPRSG